MKHSLKKRIAFLFIIIVVVTLTVIGIVHLAFIESFYTKNKQKILILSYRRLNSSQSEEDIQNFMNFCSLNGLTFALADENLKLSMTNSKDGNVMISFLFGSLMQMEEESTRVIEENDKYEVVYFSDNIDNVDYLQLMGQIDNGYYYIVRYPMNNIKEAADLSFRFYIMIGIVMLIISVVVIWKTTSALTSPIEELSVLSRRMAELDFEARYTGSGDDEINQLGANFNKMSSNLELVISKLKSANLQLEKDIKEKDKLDETRREFISNVSHDLKTPISLIQGYAEGLKEMSQDIESRNFYCDVIIDESKRMNRLVRQLLSLNQLESGAKELDLVRFDICEIINGIINSSSLVTSRKGIEVVNDCPSPMYVWADEFMIEEVLSNYISNAFNHVSGEMKIHITAESKEKTAVISVFNTGQPIPEEEMEKIWTKFYKVDKARTSTYGGNGIGLSIVKAIIDQHGQKCWAQNYENGVAFKFTLSCDM